MCGGRESRFNYIVTGFRVGGQQTSSGTRAFRQLVQRYGRGLLGIQGWRVRACSICLRVGFR